MSDETKVDPALVRELAEILRDTDLTEIEVETDDLRVHLSRVRAFAPVAQQGVAPVQVAAAPPNATQQAAPAYEGASAGASSAGGGTVLPSPMVGTAYLSPSPGASSFVSVGAKVSEGDTLLIIEAMKVMNQIPAPRDGTIREIMCEDGQPVEFDQPLMRIE